MAQQEQELADGHVGMIDAYDTDYMNPDGWCSETSGWYD